MAVLNDVVRRDEIDVLYYDIDDYGLYEPEGPTRDHRDSKQMLAVFAQLQLRSDTAAYSYDVLSAEDPYGRISGSYYFPEVGAAIVQNVHAEEDPYREEDGEADLEGHQIGLPSSEILYQGLKKVASIVGSASFSAPSIIWYTKYVFQDNVANDGTKAMIRKAYKDLQLDKNQRQVFRLNDPARDEKDWDKANRVFYILAGTDNVRPTIWMAIDHRKALGYVIDIYVHTWTMFGDDHIWMAVQLIKATSHEPPR